MAEAGVTLRPVIVKVAMAALATSLDARRLNIFSVLSGRRRVA
ncbi:hypothetical protein [Renibacterium salmoninarum]|nr:hypothetical protein [Renibacterium salmoninarum]